MGDLIKEFNRLVGIAENTKDGDEIETSDIFCSGVGGYPEGDKTVCLLNEPRGKTFLVDEVIIIDLFPTNINSYKSDGDTIYIRFKKSNQCKVIGGKWANKVLNNLKCEE